MPKEKRNHAEIRIRGVSEKLCDDLHNISQNLGVSISTMLKPKIREVIEAYPEHMKRPHKD